MRYLIITILILVMLGAVGMVVLKKSSVVPATPTVGQTILHGSYVSADPGLGYSIDFDRNPGMAWVLSGQGSVMGSAYMVNGNKLHLAITTLDLTLMPDGTIQCPPGFGPLQSVVTLKRHDQ
ncbi:MAG: hypothetical protein ABSB74_05375 [Tepidisphaeraceae bacterium]|jgi:hypothetical protein